MSGEAWAFLGSAFGGLVAVVVAVVRTRGSADSADRSATVSEVEALGRRLDETNRRLDNSEAREGKLIRYVYVLQRTLNQSGIDVPAPPEGLDL